MKHNQSFQYLICLLIALLMPGVAFADNKDENGIPWYQIEIIIFANQNQQGMISETWPEPNAISATQLHELTHAYRFRRARKDLESICTRLVRRGSSWLAGENW